MRCLPVLASLVVGGTLAVAPAHADVRGMLRFGVLPLELESSSDTPLFGDDIDRAVRDYNEAAATRDRIMGGQTRRISTRDLGLDETLFILAPGIEAGGDRVFFRLEAALGLGESMRSYGAGIYPLNFQLALGRQVSAYLSGGGTASVLDRTDSSHRGGLVTVRAATGVRYDKLAVEVGYSAFALGGIVDDTGLDRQLTREELEGELPSPVGRVEAGEARGLFDVSVGLAF